MAAVARILDTDVLSEEAKKLEHALLQKIIGQERAVNAFVRVYQQVMVGLNKPDRPAAVFLFCGPTGCGKTKIVQATAEYLLGKPNAITRVDCGEYQHSHEISKLIGSPPGYVGYGDRNARLSQEAINKHQTDSCKMNFVLFDEIEEAHVALTDAILQILDSGKLTLGNGDVVDFSRTIVVMTSNIGEKEMQAAMSGKTLGLSAPDSQNSEQTDEELYRAAKSAVQKYFKAKFVNRIDRLIVFCALTQEHLHKILKNEMLGVQERVWKMEVDKWTANPKEGTLQIFHPTLKLTESAENFLLAEGYSRKYGARELNRAIDRFVVFPLGSLIGTKQIRGNDILEIDHEPNAKKLTFKVVGVRDLTPIPQNGNPRILPEKPPKEELPPQPKRRPWGKIGKPMPSADVYAMWNELARKGLI